MESPVKDKKTGKDEGKVKTGEGMVDTAVRGRQNAQQERVKGGEEVPG